MISSLLNHPGWILILGGGLALLLPDRLRAPFALVLPLIAIAVLVGIPLGTNLSGDLAGLALTPLRLDRLAFIFCLIFLVAAFLGLLFAIPERNRWLDGCGLIYAGAAVGAALAGDLVTLFVYWEFTALASLALVLTRDAVANLQAGLRYLAIQVGSGILLLAGATVHYRATGSLEFGHLGTETPGGLLILTAFGIKCAFPFLHNWLQDTYPRASAGGTVMLSAFTTKLAVYALARGYAGTEELMWIGATMTAFPIFFAVLENDLRKVLAYSLNNQLGFMVAGIGIGTPLALDGAAAHAFAHILYKALLFMSMGAVLHQVGTTKASELGGLYKSMPFTTACCLVGSASISAFPLFSGFVTKSLILAAAAYEGHWLLWLVLLFASAGVLDHSGIKVPFFAFFAHTSDKRCTEAPWPMRIAMGITAALCIGIGIYPDPLYAILPFGSAYHPYTASHVISQMQLLLFAALAFVVLFRTGLYPPEVRGINLDADWLYRRVLPRVTARVLAATDQLATALGQLGARALTRSGQLLHAVAGDGAPLSRAWSVGLSSAILLLLVALLLV